MKEYLNKITCGNCLEHLKNLPDNSVDLIVTDPPYNLKKDFENDNLTEEEFISFLVPIFNELYRVIKDKYSVIIFFDSGQKLPLFWKTLFASKLNFQKACNFYKPNDCSMPHNRILRKSEVFYVCSKTKQLNHGGEKYIHDCLIGNHISKDKRFFHPTVKNIHIIKEIIRSSSLENDIILDPFIGSGTTAVACRELKRQFIGFELSQEYVDIANKRLKRISGGYFQ